jgi:hypothetical protein
MGGVGRTHGGESYKMFIEKLKKEIQIRVKSVPYQFNSTHPHVLN